MNGTLSTLIACGALFAAILSFIGVLLNLFPARRKVNVDERKQVTDELQAAKVERDKYYNELVSLRTSFIELQKQLQLYQSTHPDIIPMETVHHIERVHTPIDP